MICDYVNGYLGKVYKGWFIVIVKDVNQMMSCICFGMKELSIVGKKLFVYFYLMNGSFIVYELLKKYCNVFIYIFDYLF